MEIVLFIALIVAGCVFIGAFIYDHRNGYRSNQGGKNARTVGTVAWITVMLSLVLLVVADWNEDTEPSDKVLIECVVGDSEALTCEVLK